MNPPSAQEWSLGLKPARRWSECDALGVDPVLSACLGPARHALLTSGVRELIANAFQHGGIVDPDARLVLDPSNGREWVASLALPGPAFDSTDSRNHRVGGFLERFAVLLREDGTTWSWSHQDGCNHIELRFSSTSQDLLPTEVDP